MKRYVQYVTIVYLISGGIYAQGVVQEIPADQPGQNGFENVGVDNQWQTGMQQMEQEQQWQQAVAEYDSTQNPQVLLQKAQELVAKGYDVTVIAQDAINRDIKSIITWLLDNKKIGKDTKLGDRTLVMHAALARAKNVLQDLIKREFSIKDTDDQGRTALLYAALGGSPQVVGILVAKGTDVTAKDNDGNTVLMAVVRGKNTNVGGAQGGKDPEGTLRYLINTLKKKQKNKFNINTQNKAGWTVLMEAANNLMPDLVQLLLDNGAKASVKNPDGQTALDLVKIALQSFTSQLSDLQKQVKEAETEQVKQFYQKSVDAYQQKITDGKQIVMLLSAKK